jgi:RimJ/RimL family protein N-acetyltransferase
MARRAAGDGAASSPGRRRAARSGSAAARAAIHAFRPRLLVLRDGRAVTLRAVRPQDDGAILRAFHRLSPRTRYLRFMQHKKELDPRILARGVRPQAGRECALVATVLADAGYDVVGAARYVQADTPDTCEFAVTVADDWSGSGLATAIMSSLLRCAARDGYTHMVGNVLSENAAMLALARRLGFRTHPHPDEANLVRVRRPLAPAPARSAR